MSDECKVKRKRWTEDEVATLTKVYETSMLQKQIMELIPGRTWVSLKLKAEQLSLVRPSNAVWSNQVIRLAEQTPEAYYWLGMLLADGNFSPLGRVRLRIGIQDEAHARKFAAYIGAKIQCHSHVTNFDRKGNPTQYVCVAAMHSAVVKNLMEEFSIVSNKTCQPPSFDHIYSDILFVSLVIGLIDGDGTITHLSHRADCSIRLKMHKAWLPILDHVSYRLAQWSNTEMVVAKINNQGYAQVAWGNSILIKKLRNFIQEHHLPHIERKWNKVDVHLIGRCEQSQINENAVQHLLNQHLRQKEIATCLNLSKAGVCLIVKRLKRKEILHNESR